MNFQDTVDYMYGMLPMYQRVGKSAFKKDLTNTLKLCEILNNPQEKFYAIHIAGTNGKGSSAHMLASILQTAGYKTGLYTSPHLKSFTERIKVNGNEIEEQFVCDFIEKIKDHIRAIQPSFFEITVAMAFDYFARQQVDLAVIEVGLGGRFDSTNVLTPIVSLITSIGLDHTDMLGETLPEIAFEKAGIIKQHVPVVISETQQQVVPVFKKKANEMQAPIFFADQKYNVSIASSDHSVLGFSVKTKENVWNGHTDLGGEYQVKNIPGVLQVIELICHRGREINQGHVSEGLKNVKSKTGLYGRWQKLSDHPLTICDTVHNEAGVIQLIDQLHKVNYKNLHIIWGAVEGKDLRGIFRHLPDTAFYYFCEASIPRILDAMSLQAIAHSCGREGMVIRNVNQAIQTARANANERDMILIGGSNFIIAEITNLKIEEKAAKV